MQIQPIYEANTNRQQNPFYIQSVGYPMAEKNASQVSFKDCLKVQIQKEKTPATTAKTESQSYRVDRGYYIRRGLSNESGSLQKASAY